MVPSGHLCLHTIFYGVQVYASSSTVIPIFSVHSSKVNILLSESTIAIVQLGSRNGLKARLCVYITSLRWDLRLAPSRHRHIRTEQSNRITRIIEPDLQRISNNYADCFRSNIVGLLCVQWPYSVSRSSERLVKQ